MKNFCTTRFGQLLLATISMFYSKTVSAQNWTAIPGITAQDISIGKNGTVWITSKENLIYRWDGSKFEQIQGWATKIAVDPNGIAWVVNGGGEVFKYNPNTPWPNTWTKISGGTQSLAVGANGSIWRIGSDVAGGGYGIYRWNGSNWDNIPGGAVQIAVDASGNAWVVQSNGATWKYNPANTGPANTWVNMQVLSKNISVGADGSVWRIGTDAESGGFGVYKWDGGTSWNKVAGSAVRVAGDASGNIWAVNSTNIVYRPGKTTAANNTGNVIPNTPPARTGKVRLQNVGQLAVTVFRTTAGNKKDSIAEIAGNSGLEVMASVGDRLTVQFEDPAIKHRAIYIPDVTDEPTYFIYGNVPMKDFGGYGMNLSNMSIDPNLYGVDTGTVGKRAIANSMNKMQIFERLNPTIGTDYYVSGDGVLMKAGFNFGNIGEVRYTNGSRMSYGSSSFSDGWSVALSGSFPVKAVDVAGGFGYSQSQQTQSSSTDVYVYQRYQNITHQVGVTPSKAYLESEFIDRIRRLKTDADAANLIRDYGTHYPSVVYYGGDLSSYLKMNSSDFMNATSKSMNLQIEVTKSSPATKQTQQFQDDQNPSGTHTQSFKDTRTTKTPGSTSGGKLSFEYKQETEERRLLENSESKYMISGGNYTMGGDYSVDRNNAVPLAIVLRRIDELITPGVIKNDIDPADIAKAQVLVKKAIDSRISQIVSARPIQLPPPNIYEITLDTMQIPWQMDDANANTRGSVEAIVYSDVAQQNRLPMPPGKLWEQKGYSLDFRFSPYNVKVFTNAKQTIVHQPDPATGQFKLLFLNVIASIQEKDDNLAYPDGAILKGSFGNMEIHGLNLQPGGPGVTKTFEAKMANEGIIKITFTIKKLENHFDSPGDLNQIITGQAN